MTDKSLISELRSWAKDDIVPNPLKKDLKLAVQRLIDLSRYAQEMEDKYGAERASNIANIAELQRADDLLGEIAAALDGESVESKENLPERVRGLLTKFKTAESNYDKAVKDPVVKSLNEGGVNAMLTTFAAEVKEALGDLWDRTPNGPSAADAIRSLRKALEEAENPKAKQPFTDKDSRNAFRKGIRTQHFGRFNNDEFDDPLPHVWWRLMDDVDRLEAEVEDLKSRIDSYVVSFNDERARADKMQEERDVYFNRAEEMESIAEGLSAVFDARFHAFMRGDTLRGLDVHLPEEALEKERATVVVAVEKLSPMWKAMNAVVEAALQLRNSGYDGPFIGEVCAPLFSAVAAYEKMVADVRKEDDDFMKQLEERKRQHEKPVG